MGCLTLQRTCLPHPCPVCAGKGVEAVIVVAHVHVPALGAKRGATLDLDPGPNLRGGVMRKEGCINLY